MVRLPESLAMCLRIHPRGGPVSSERFRRRDADGCGRDDHAPGEVANDRGATAAGLLRAEVESRLDGVSPYRLGRLHFQRIKFGAATQRRPTGSVLERDRKSVFDEGGGEFAAVIDRRYMSGIANQCLTKAGR